MKYTALRLKQKVQHLCLSIPPCKLYLTAIFPKTLNIFGLPWVQHSCCKHNIKQIFYLRAGLRPVESVARNYALCLGRGPTIYELDDATLSISVMALVTG